MQIVCSEIDNTLPPYCMPNFDGKVPKEQYQLEPYSELSDFLDKNDFSNLLGVLGQFAGKTGSGLLNFGESIFSQFKKS